MPLSSGSRTVSPQTTPTFVQEPADETHHQPHISATVCAKFVTTTPKGHREGGGLLATWADRQVPTIHAYSPPAQRGQASHYRTKPRLVSDPCCERPILLLSFYSSYVVSDAVVSGLHCKLYALVLPSFMHEDKALMFAMQRSVE